jgi:hypothetical protein
MHPVTLKLVVLCLAAVIAAIALALLPAPGWS